jgi:aminoglycoside phosphotransferase (APT) family kinase protein
MLHSWVPSGEAEKTLREPLDHGGFLGRDALLAEVEKVAVLDRLGAVPRRLLDGVAAIAEGAPLTARTEVPVHGDCHWDNWLACDRRVTALLDFEWARLGDPLDDWFFLIRFAGPHMELVLDVVARATSIPDEALRDRCEFREAAHLTADLRIAFSRPDAPAHQETAADRIRALAELVDERYWWRERP